MKHFYLKIPKALTKVFEAITDITICKKSPTNLSEYSKEIIISKLRKSENI